MTEKDLGARVLRVIYDKGRNEAAAITVVPRFFVRQRREGRSVQHRLT